MTIFLLFDLVILAPVKTEQPTSTTLNPDQQHYIKSAVRYSFVFFFLLILLKMFSAINDAVTDLTTDCNL